MRNRFSLMVILMFLLMIPAVHAQESLTLKECFDLAIKRSEVIAIQREFIKETEGLMMQSLSNALPKVAFSYSEKWQDLQGADTIRDHAPEGKFTFSQPLFTGFKEFAAIAASRHIGKQRDFELKRAGELLFIDVADAFYLFLSYQEDSEALNDIHKALEERLIELKRRELIGRSRPSDTAATQSRLKKIEATIELTNLQRDIAGNLLEFLIGHSVDRLVDDVEFQGLLPIEELVSKVDRRSDIEAIREAVDVYKNNVVAARSQLMPLVTLSGNSYTKRTGTSEGNDWDVMLGVNVPLFNGLSDFGSIRQARSQVVQSDLCLSQALRRARMEIKNAYVKFLAYGRRFEALVKALEAADLSYKFQLEDFAKSLVGNLDVLQALEDLEGVRRESIAAKADMRRSFWFLKVTAGENLE